MIHRIRAFLSTLHGLVAVALAVVASAAGLLALVGEPTAAVAVLALVVAIVSVAVVDGHKKSAILLRDVGRLDTTTRTELRRTSDTLESTAARIELAHRDSASDLRVLREQVLVRLDLVEGAIEGVGGRLDTSDQRIERLGRTIGDRVAQADEGARARHAELGDRMAQADKGARARHAELASDQRRIARQSLRVTNGIVSEVDAVLQLHQRLPLEGPLPLVAGWALSARGILNIVDIVERDRPELVVECGSGTSTLFIAAAFQRLGIDGRVVSLEHLPNYADHIRRLLSANGLLPYADVRVAPLEDVDLEGERFSWYSPSAFEDLADIDLLLVDGPPEGTGTMARYPALPVLRDRLRPHATIVLDDARRDDERAILERWSSLAPLTPQVSLSADVAILQLGQRDPSDGVGP